MNAAQPRRIRPAPIRKSITVPAPAGRAFEVFTTGFGRWWPSTHSIGKSAMRDAVIEPRVGGRWFEVGEDGSECDWGEVLAWEPPTRLVLAWRIGTDWRFALDLLTEVEINFASLADGTTRVDLEHRYLERMGEAAGSVVEAFESDKGWGGLLGLYAEAVSH